MGVSISRGPQYEPLLTGSPKIWIPKSHMTSLPRGLHLAQISQHQRKEHIMVDRDKVGNHARRSYDDKDFNMLGRILQVIPCFD